MRQRKIIKRGQVWWYSPSGNPSGHIQRGERPVIIISNDQANLASTVVLGIPCTSQVKRNFPTHTLFVLDKTVNVALAEQIMPINVNDLTNLKYTLEPSVMRQIDDCIRVAVGLDTSYVQRVTCDSFNACSSEEDIEQESSRAIEKFYAKYPHLRPKSSGRKNVWTAEKKDTFVHDSKVFTEEEMCKRYNINAKTLKVYKSKFAAEGTK